MDSLTQINAIARVFGKDKAGISKVGPDLYQFANTRFLTLLKVDVPIIAEQYIPSMIERIDDDQLLQYSRAKLSDAEKSIIPKIREFGKGHGLFLSGIVNDKQHFITEIARFYGKNFWFDAQNFETIRTNVGDLLIFPLINKFPKINEE